MTIHILQLVSGTGSLGAVRALQGVSSDLHAGAESQPGGLTEISRGLKSDSERTDTPGTPSQISAA